MGWGNESPLVQLKRDAARARRLEVERDAAIAERDGAQQECADLWDAVDKARSVLDDALSTIRRRGQDEEHARVAEAVTGAMTEQGDADV